MIETCDVKLYRDMSKDEVLYLTSLTKKMLNTELKFTDHSLKRMKERNIYKKDVVKAFKNFQIIEYRKYKNQDFLTIRSCSVKNNNQVFVVFSLKTKKVITVYQNKYLKNISLENNNYENIFISIPNRFKKQIELFY